MIANQMNKEVEENAQTSKEVNILQRGSKPVSVLLQTFMGYIDHCVSLLKNIQIHQHDNQNIPHPIPHQDFD